VYSAHVSIECYLWSNVHCVCPLYRGLALHTFVRLDGNQSFAAFASFAQVLQKIIQKAKAKSLRVFQRWVACKYAFDYTLQTKAKW